MLPRFFLKKEKEDGGCCNQHIKREQNNCLLLIKCFNKSFLKRIFSYRTVHCTGLNQLTRFPQKEFHFPQTHLTSLGSLHGAKATSGIY